MVIMGDSVGAYKYTLLGEEENLRRERMMGWRMQG
jgi:hypothetical protein